MKRFFSCLLVAVLLISCMATMAFAAEVKTGDTFTVSYSISGNPGFSDYKATINYNQDVLELTAVNAGALSQGGIFQPNPEAGLVGFITTTDITGDGVLFTAEFKVKENTEGKSFNVSIALDYANNAAGNEVTLSGSASGNTSGTVAHTCVEDAGTVTKEATCKEEGVKTFKCTICGEVVRTEAIAKLPHTVGEWEKDANQHWHICSVCGEKVDAANHNVTNWTKNEKDEYVGNCTVCNYLVNKGKVVPAGDITPVLTMGAVAMISMLAAVAFVFKRKFAK